MGDSHAPTAPRGALGAASELERGGYVLWDSAGGSQGSAQATGDPAQGDPAQGGAAQGGAAQGGAAQGGAAQGGAAQGGAQVGPAQGNRAQGGAAPTPQLILISTGAEVAPTLEAARMLAAQDTGVRVVSMPCMELFEAQSQEYRDAVLPPAVSARLAVEPGATMSWWKWVGSHGDVLGLDRFGASAPGTKVLEELGFTAESIAARARALL